jgi:hypothetical protein
MLPVVLAILGILAYIRVAYTKRLPRLFSGVVRLQIMRQIMREELVFSHRASVLLFVNYVLAAALLVYAFAKYAGRLPEACDGQATLWAIAGVLLGAWLIKLATNFALAWLFQDRGLMREYMYEVFLIHKTFGLLLLPLTAAALFMHSAYVETVFMSAGALTAALFIFRLVQGAIMCTQYTISGVYIILYLCTLEILPLLVLRKTLLGLVAA